MKEELKNVILMGLGVMSLTSEKSKELREELRKANVDNATKQKVIIQLNKKIDDLKAALKEEEGKTNRNEDTIRILKEQLNDILETLKVAEAA